MNKKCSTCGTPALDEMSQFCNRCGARLPAGAPVMTCRKCGKTFTDPQSRFCNRCGSPLAPAAQAAASPAVPQAVPAAVKGTHCPACGFENLCEIPFYCKRCGTYVPGREPITRQVPAREAPRSVPSGGGVRIRPDGMDGVRQRPLYGTAEEQELPQMQRQEPHGKRTAGSYRRVAYIAAGAVALVLIVAVFTGVIPGIPGTGSANATFPDILNISAGNPASPGLFEGLSLAIFPNQTPVVTKAVTTIAKTGVRGAAPALNKATTLVTDLPLTVAGN